MQAGDTGWKSILTFLKLQEETQLSLSRGLQLLLTPFCCAKQYSHHYLGRQNSPCSFWSSVIKTAVCSVSPITLSSHFSQQLPSLLTIMFLLSVTSYLLFLVVSGLQGFHFPTETTKQSCFSLAFSLKLMVLFSMVWSSSLWILALKAPSALLVVKILSEGGWSTSQVLYFPGGCFNHNHLPHQWPCFFYTTSWEKDFASWIKRSITKPESGPFLVALLLLTSPSGLFCETYCAAR